MLNSGDCFDLKLYHQENDILQLHFTLDARSETQSSPRQSGYLAYAFIYQNKKWKATDYDPFDANFGVIQKGKIIMPFARSSEQ